MAGVSVDTGDERLMGFDGKAWRTAWHGRPGQAARLACRRRDILGAERQRSLPAAAGPPGTGPPAGRLTGNHRLGVAPEKGGVLLVGTSQGLARYAPPLWQTPPALAGLDRDGVGAIEDHKGRLWLCYRTGW